MCYMYLVMAQDVILELSNQYSVVEVQEKHNLKYKTCCEMYILNCVILPKITKPTERNGGAQPVWRRKGNTKFPIIAPILPNIIAREMVVVLKVETINDENKLNNNYYTLMW